MAADLEAASCYFVEILQRLQVAQVSTLLDGTKHITFLGSSIISNGNRNTAFAIDGLGLRPTTYSCLKVTGGNELHVRFKLAELEGQNVESKLQLKKPESTTLALRCRFCRSLLTDYAHEFERVLPLPSDAWQEFYADIFCHMDHSHGTPSSQPPSTIQPREGDCLVADDKLLVTISSLRQESIAIDSSKEGTIRVMCKRCCSLLGTMVQESNCHTREADNTSPIEEGGVSPLCLKMSKLLIEEEGEGNRANDLLYPKGSQWKTLEDYFARRIYGVSVATESFRFVLQSDLGSTHIWVLSTGNRVAWSLHHPPRGNHDFSGCYDGPEMESCCTEVSSSRPIIKLLYKATYTAEDEAEILKWDEEDWLNFNWILSNRTKALPPSHRIANGFHVGFLCFL